jgi:hypothetical protein
MAFMRRLAALVPPPRCPLIRFHGVFGPHSRWRSAVVPETNALATRDRKHVCAGEREPTVRSQGRSPATTTPSRPPMAESATAVLARAAGDAAGSNLAQNDAIGPRFTAPWRIDWASLLRRV